MTSGVFYGRMALAEKPPADFRINHKNIRKGNAYLAENKRYVSGR